MVWHMLRVSFFQLVVSLSFLLMNCSAMQADSQEESHPVVQQHNGDIASIIESFDTITYCKGASILRMLCHCVGRDRFLEGIGAFVVTHQYGCATQEDLWKAVQVSRVGCRMLFVEYCAFSALRYHKGL